MNNTDSKLPNNELEDELHEPFDGLIINGYGIYNKKNQEDLTKLISKREIEARIDELKRLKKIDVFNELYNTDPRPSKLVDIRITDLQNQNQTS